MLKCRQVSEQASDYIDRQQTPMQRAGFLLHLLMCGHCRAFIQQLKITREYGKKIASESDFLNQPASEQQLKSTLEAIEQTKTDT